MKQCFVPKNFTAAHTEIIDQANAILDEYRRQRLTLTLRQLYYQFVSRDLIENKQTEYKRLGGIISDARLAGMIDWEMMEDRTRFIRELPAWGSPGNAIEAIAEQYREDLWELQPRRVEVWIEKDALVGVIEAVCEEWRVPYIACRGYTSQSMQYEAGKRAKKARNQRTVILHLGDHDPSGMDMTRDNEDRINLFAGGGVKVIRLALNFDQVERYDPPPNPAKETDSRASGYIEKYGESSWELDALDPDVISDLIRTNVEEQVNQSIWDSSLQEETRNRELLEECSRRWDDVEDLMRQ